MISKYYEIRGNEFWNIDNVMMNSIILSEQVDHEIEEDVNIEISRVRILIIEEIVK